MWLFLDSHHPTENGELLSVEISDRGLVWWPRGGSGPQDSSHDHVEFLEPLFNGDQAIREELRVLPKYFLDRVPRPLDIL